MSSDLSYYNASAADLSSEERSSLAADLLKYAERGSPHQFSVAILTCKPFADPYLWTRALNILLDEPVMEEGVWFKISDLLTQSPLLECPLGHNQINKIVWREALRGNTDNISYLLNGEKTRHLCSVRADRGQALSHAVKGLGGLRVVQFLCESPELSEHADVRDGNSEAIIVAGRHVMGGYHKEDILRYLVGRYDPDDTSGLEHLVKWNQTRALDGVFSDLSDQQKKYVIDETKHRIGSLNNFPHMKAYDERGVLLKATGDHQNLPVKKQSKI